MTCLLACIYALRFCWSLVLNRGMCQDTRGDHPLHYILHQYISISIISMYISLVMQIVVFRFKMLCSTLAPLQLQGAP